MLINDFLPKYLVTLSLDKYSNISFASSVVIFLKYNLLVSNTGKSIHIHPILIIINYIVLAIINTH
ncbi:hypothetical protein SDC9_114240 [bioreactor metagenome]|uniref:Uncharacterized protein n=1 Tax=bioreactor metagenome TaxID=1076179 RepID=A0A645BQD2_9ZZZZ